MDIKAYLKDKKALVDAFLDSYLSSPFPPRILHDSMAYSLTAGGKRIRPVLCLAAYEACGGKAEDVVAQATALEFIHTYSLIHDDLPAMDNDDLRRGKPTNHKVFGDAMAILSGDALLTEAFYLLSHPVAAAQKRENGGFDSKSCAQLLRVIHEVAFASGAKGMVGGQAQDLLSENSEPDVMTLSYIHEHKTAALIAVSVRMGGILAGCNEELIERLDRYGEDIGLAFQVIDDILDVEGETEVIGKPKGSDEKKNKMTYPRLFGIDESRRKAKELIGSAIDSLSVFDEKAEPLRAIARYLYDRKS
ncbi:MAG TPA: farnesyl diphosphate synthase [Dissulfurispiraceae bacterium]|nr:farnesyl diphosphate synthase [Dissulfurispiraceae bacterium]